MKNKNIDLKQDFYIKIKGEVYACRFKKLEAIIEHSFYLYQLSDFYQRVKTPFDTIRKFFGHISEEDYYPRLTSNTKASLSLLHEVVIDVCDGIGERRWIYEGQRDFSLDDIYLDTKDFPRIFHDKPFKEGAFIVPYPIPMNKVTPSEMSWEHVKILEGKSEFWLRSYKWNGINPEEVSVLEMPEIYYDLITDKITVDNRTGYKLYPTAEECYSDNLVKVHYFND